MVQAQCFIFSVPAQVTESYNVVVTDQEPHCLFWVLGLGLKPSVCHSEPVRIRYARLNCYLTVEEYRPEVKLALRSAYSEVELCRQENRFRMICSAPVSSRTLQAYCDICRSAGDGNGVFSARVAARGTGEIFFLCDHCLS
jgi:hypothetical protein